MNTPHIEGEHSSSYTQSQKAVFISRSQMSSEITKYSVTETVLKTVNLQLLFNIFL